MNLLDFDIEAGFPFTESTVKFMQGMMLQLQYGSLLGGSNYILSGCTQSGSIISNGWVVVNGEVMPFQGGAVQANVVVTETVTDKEFFGGLQNDYYRVRIATFGTGATQYAWNTFKRNDPANGVLARLDKVEKMLTPLLAYTIGGTTVYGSWLFWGRPASEIPAGWEAVPDSDWKGRVPVVLDSADTDFDTVGELGGSKTVSLVQGNLPNIQIDIPGAKGVGGITKDAGGGGYGFGNDKDPADVPLKTATLGSGTAFKIQMKYKVVMFIRFIG